MIAAPRIVHSPAATDGVRARCRVIALVPSAGLSDALSAAAGDGVALTVCSDLSAFERQIAVSAVDRVILELGSGLSAEASLRAATRVVPPARIIGICTLSLSSMRDTAAAARNGVTQIAIHGHDDLALYVRAPIEEPKVDDVRAWLEAATRARAAGPVLELLLLCLDTARREGTVNAVAGVAGVHRVTLIRQFRQLGLPQPKTVVRGYRLLLAAGLIEYTTQPVVSACAAAGFSSYAVFRRTLSHYTRLKPKSLRCQGQFHQLTRAALDAMLRDCAPRLGTTSVTQWATSGTR